MVSTRHAPSQAWKTFLRNHAGAIASIDIFVVRTISSELLCGLVILRPARRRMVSVGDSRAPGEYVSLRWLPPNSRPGAGSAPHRKRGSVLVGTLAHRAGSSPMC
jgi:hypothetical protein